MELTPVYVMHTRAFQNTSLIVELFSEIHGRIAVVARSARGPRSRFRGQLQLFSPMLASWFGNHELKSLTQIELNGMPLQLNEKPLFCGFYLNELLIRLLHKEDPHPALFRLYHESLCRLENNKNEADLPVILRFFEKKFLEELGYALPLTCEAKTRHKINPDDHYHFIPKQGFFLSKPDDVYQQQFLGVDLIGIAEEMFHQESVLFAAKKIMGVAIADLLGNKPLQSRLFF